MITDPATQPVTKQNGFIVLEGVNGAGKTTVRDFITEHLAALSLPFIKTHEPGDSPLGKELRRILLERDFTIQSVLSELFLFAADRSEHVESVIKPALERKEIVVCDRYYYSTTAFQGFGRSIDLNLINQINEIAISGTRPDLVILLDLDPAEGLRRTGKRSESGDNGKDLFEKEVLDFHTRIREGFLKIARESREKFVIIDASKPVEEVLSAVGSILNSYLGTDINE